MPTNSPSFKRLEVRLSPDLHEMVKLAASLEGCTLTAFVVEAVQNAAREVIESDRILRLSMADQEAFVDALISPAAPNEAMSRAIEHHKSLLKSAND